MGHITFSKYIFLSKRARNKAENDYVFALKKNETSFLLCENTYISGLNENSSVI